MTERDPTLPRPRRTSIGQRVALALSLVAIAGLAVGGWVELSTSGARPILPPNPGECPSVDQLGRLGSDPNISVQLVVNGNDTVARYDLDSSNASPTNPAPSLIAYCVYPQGALPTSAHAIAVGGNGTALTPFVGDLPGYFAYLSGNTSATNLPLDELQNLTIGNATWSGSVPSNQSVVLHIDAPTICPLLYGAGTDSCFVLPAYASTHCPETGLNTPLEIRLAEPNQLSPIGSTLQLEYSLAVTNYSSADLGVTVFVPQVKFDFPLGLYPALQIVQAPHAIVIEGSGWSAPVGRTVTLENSTGFNGSVFAHLTSSHAAVMTNSLVSLSVNFRWGWVLTVGSSVEQAWTVPNASAPPSNFPSIFTPVPYVSALSTSGGVVSAGSYYGVVLDGAISNRSFCTTVETSGGIEIHGEVQSSPSSSAPTYEVGVPLTYPNGVPLPPGGYWIHVHDSQAAIVVILWIRIA